MRRIANVFVLAALMSMHVGADRNWVSKKRGVSTGGKTAAAVNAGWYYTWYIDPDKDVAAEFVPMIAHGKDANSWYFDRINELKKAGKVTCLLGFNEPDRKHPGAEISVDGAVAAWPQFEKTGLRLGSPAVAFDGPGRKWLDEFMAKTKAKNLRVDFIAVHWYGDVKDPRAADQFMAWLKGIHDQHGKPIWITEFAGLNWGWLGHSITADMDQRFLTSLVPKLEQTEWVERYCWFSADPASLFEKDHQTLTAVGRAYAGK